MGELAFSSPQRRLRESPKPARRGSHLLVGRTDDPLEREADAVARRLVPGGRSQSLRPRTPADGPGLDERGGSLAAAELRRPSGGHQLSASTRSWYEQRLGADLSAVRVHDGPVAAEVTERAGASALTWGRDIWLAGAYGDTPSFLLAHELTHVVQQAHAPGAVPTARSPGTGIGVVLRHPALGVLRRAGRWLARRSTRTVSKHIARHGRAMAGRSVHTVFRIPRKIRSYVRRALDDAERLASRATRHGATEVLEEGGVRVFRQSGRVPGKFRIVVEKTFRSPIGTRGERILRIVMDQSGRLVTAFPVDRFLSIGLSAGAASVFTASTAEAAERVRERIEAEAAREDDVDLVTWLIDVLVAPSVANEGEQLWLDLRDILRETVARVIAEVEEAEQMSLGEDQREAIEDLVAAAIATPLVLEDEGAWDDTER